MNSRYMSNFFLFVFFVKIFLLDFEHKHSIGYYR